MKKIAYLFLIICSVTFNSCGTALEVIGGLATLALMPDTPQSSSYYYQPTSMSSSYSGGYYSSSGYSSSSSYTTTASSATSSSGRMCQLCAGSGQCKTCMGRGYYYSSFGSSTKLSCPNCDRNHNGNCSSCHGTGKR